MRAFRLRAAALALVLSPLLVQGCDSTVGPGTPPDGPAAPAPSGPALFPVMQDGTRALMDATGRVVVTLEGYSATRPGGEGLTPARKWDGQRNVWDFFDASGTPVFRIAADEVDAPRQGLIRIRIDGRSGFVDPIGRFIVNPYLYDARSFQEDHARVKTTGSRWGFMDRSGRVVVDPQWSDLADLSGGRARFRSNDLYGYISATGEELIPAVYADARSFAGGLAAVREGQRWFYIDGQNARTMGSTTFISAGDFSDGLAPVRTENLWEYIDAAGARVIGPQFDEARAFVDGLAAVRIGSAWTFIDRAGTPIRPPEFDEVADFEGGLAAVQVNGATGYIDRSGAYVWIPR